MAQNVSSDGLPGLARQLSRTVTDAGKSQTGVPIVCYITQADNSVLQVEVEHRALAQEVLDKICKILGIVEESEYFGIQYIGGKNELLWLNNRNRLSRQVPSQPPYHLYFKVKFYIPPEDVLLEGTRHQFYINVVHQLKEGVWDSGTTLDTQSHLIALMAYVQFGRFNANTTPCKYACFWPDSRGEIPAEVIRSAANFHRSLDDFTVSQAQYELLRIVSTEVPSYGMYFYEVKDIFERRLILGVGPEGLVLCNSNYVVNDKFPYCRVHTITTSSRVVTLNLLEDDGSVKGRNYQLASPRLASSLYRSVTEVYAFFRCDSVKKEVLLQTRRDFRDTITFHHNGKEYAFDVRSTFREVFDRARRHLYHCANSTTPHGSPPNASAPICSSLMMSDSSFVPSSSETPAHRASGDAGSGLKRDYSSRAESMIGDEVSIISSY
ncbi:E3 ubiquitin protein ligase MYLIP [Paragonimus heterotremus]|uniref:RING-type E3 ubiquitin transferase n=1 Tax=Paragonimus heterotremus TaxID=100268 RepID=A0A8J4SQM0_9TREM|nr:E3 ubiquitin protein ligase MYLIP [Paragonimus heterotremus]